MNAAFFLRGLALGFSIAAPVGPIGVLCIRRSLRDGARSGFACGLGAATADALYGGIAGFGLTSISGLLVSWQSWLGLLGGSFMCILGVRSFSAAPAEKAASGDGPGLVSSYASTFLITLSNPATILSFVGVFAAFGLAGTAGYGDATWLVLGVFLGSAAWWLILSAGVSVLRSQVTVGVMKAINVLSGSILIAFGVYAILRSLSFMEGLAKVSG
jgi:threonine/homoserine/homoserine lactone efflux protein